MHGARGRLDGSVTNSNIRSTIVSLMGGNARDEKGWDDKVISTTMEIGSGDTGDGKDVLVCKGMEGDV